MKEGAFLSNCQERPGIGQEAGGPLSNTGPERHDLVTFIRVVPDILTISLAGLLRAYELAGGTVYNWKAEGHFSSRNCVAEKSGGILIKLSETVGLTVARLRGLW